MSISPNPVFPSSTIIGAVHYEEVPMRILNRSRYKDASGNFIEFKEGTSSSGTRQTFPEKARTKADQVFRKAWADLSPLDRLMNLREIELEDTGVSDVEPLRGLADLTILLLSGTRVRDLVPLIELKNLNFLDIRKTPVDEAQVAALKKALPNLEVLN